MSSSAFFVETQELDPTTQKPLGGHDTSPRVSAAVYDLVDGKWTLVSTAKHFGYLGINGEIARTVQSDVLEFPGGQVAFLFDFPDVGAGVASTSKGVLLYTGSAWTALGYVETNLASAPEVPLNDPGYFKYTGVVSVVPRAGAIADLLVTRQGTRIEAGKRVAAGTVRYVYGPAGYAPAP